MTVDFYVRLFIRVREGAKPCHQSISKYSHVYQCMDCEAHYFQPMGQYSLEEITLDEATGRRTGRKKLGGDSKMPGDHAEAEEEEEVKGSHKKIREKYQLAQVRVPHRCTVCEGALVLGGPIWNKEIHDVEFAKRLLESVR